MIYLVDPNVALSWCPLLCKQYQPPQPLYGIDPCRRFG